MRNFILGKSDIEPHVAVKKACVYLLEEQPQIVAGELHAVAGRLLGVDVHAAHQHRVGAVQQDEQHQAHGVRAPVAELGRLCSRYSSHVNGLIKLWSLQRHVRIVFFTSNLTCYHVIDLSNGYVNPIHLCSRATAHHTGACALARPYLGRSKCPAGPRCRATR